MFKFIKQYAEKMDYATIYPIVSLIIFFLFFVVLLALVKKMSKKRADELSNLPFEQEELSNSTL